jgi:hypothetical protein
VAVAGACARTPLQAFDLSRDGTLVHLLGKFGNQRRRPSSAMPERSRGRATAVRGSVSVSATAAGWRDVITGSLYGMGIRGGASLSEPRGIPSTASPAWSANASRLFVGCSGASEPTASICSDGHAASARSSVALRG